MNTKAFLLIVCVGFFFVLIDVAPSHAAAEPSQDELLALEKFLSLSDAELDAMLAAIQRVRAMSPEQREAFARKVVEFRGLPANERQQIRMGWGWVSVDDRNDWRRMMQSLTPAERAEIHARLDAAAPQERPQVKHQILETWRKR